MRDGNSALECGNYRVAVKCFREAVRLSPERALLRSSLGMATTREDGLEEALEQFREAARLDPFAVSHRFNLGRTLQQLGKNAEGCKP